MIYDRTINDVAQAERIFKEKVLSLAVLSDDEKQILERGRVTAETLNRIEENQKEIADILKKWHYINVELETKKWSSEIFFDEDLTRLVKNTILLRDAFYTINEIRQPEPLFHFEEFNKIEQILFEIGELIKNAEKSFKYSGTFFVNQSIILPLKGAI